MLINLILEGNAMIVPIFIDEEIGNEDTCQKSHS